MDTNASRLLTFGVAHALDLVSDDSQTTITDELTPRQLPAVALADQVRRGQERGPRGRQDAALLRRHGFKKEPLQLERYLRDGKAGWVMGPTNEVLRQFVGKTALLGMDSLDYWNVSSTSAPSHNEIKKMTSDEKRELAEKLLAEANAE